MMVIVSFSRVNLPRWGLKHLLSRRLYIHSCCVNLPRWGLKPDMFEQKIRVKKLCKFTPLGFETQFGKTTFIPVGGVNLPRWGLKRALVYSS